MKSDHDEWIEQMILLRATRSYDEWRHWDYLRNLEDADFLEIEEAFRVKCANLLPRGASA